MRQIIAMVPEGQGGAALELARENEGRNLVAVQGRGEDRAWDIVFVHIPNQKVDAIIAGLQEIGDVHITLIPRGVIPLFPPASATPDQTVDVSIRSPFEIFVGGLQSIGSWRGFLSYAFCAGVVVWIGLFTSTIFLLIAAMLIAPFAGPAMTLALGTARGDWMLIRNSIARYFTSLAVCIAVAWGLSMLFSQDIATELMTQNSLVSMTAVLLPLTAGAAGALNLCQSERDSLVTAAGPGVLVAASLAPPAGVIGMSAAIGRWDLVQSSVFVLLLQLVGINAAGAAVFALFGLSPRGVRFERGKTWVRRSSYALSLAGLAALLTWQFWGQPNLQRSSLAKRITEDVKTAVERSSLAHLIEANVRFTRADISGQESLLAVVYVQKANGADPPEDEIKSTLTREIVEQVKSEGYNVTPLVDVTVFPANPDASG